MAAGGFTEQSLDCLESRTALEKRSWV